MKRVAIISGVNRYDDSSIRNLRYAVEDTRKIANLLDQAGFETRYLYDASQGRHQDELDRVSRRLEPGDLLLFYFSGHGVDVNGRHLLLCQDARDAALRFGRGGLWVEELKETFASSGANRVFVFDTCREALLTRKGVVNEMQGSATLRDIAAAPAEPDVASGSLTILCACDEGDTAQEDDDLGHGLFSAAFMDCCREAMQKHQALCLDGNCLDSIRHRMTVTARKHNLSIRQRPWIQSTGAFPVILAEPATYGSATVVDDKPARITPPSPSQAPAASKPKLKWWVTIDGREQGPLDEVAVREVIKQGKITRKTECWRDGMDAWQPIGEMTEWVSTFPPIRQAPEVITPPKREPKLSDSLELECGGGVKMKLNLIPAGTFLMGSPESKEDRKDDEGPQHEVTITKPFYMGIYPVTQAQYEAVLQKTPSAFKVKDRPVEQVSWDNAFAFCKKLSSVTDRVISLPTEAQWEYACRAGSTTTYSFGDSDSRLDSYGWYDENSGEGTHPVGQKKPNAWGLYDMHGNVWEWCSDWYVDSYANADVRDPKGPSSGTARVLRGGSWHSLPRRCRSATRLWLEPDNRGNGIGFRVVVDSE